MARAYIIVTGATAGVGFGICDSLLQQLCYSNPPVLTQTSFDLPTCDKNALKTHRSHLLPNPSLTLILPCRSIKRGESAKARLLEKLKRTVKLLSASKQPAENANRFLSELIIEVHYCDLALIKSVLEFSHLVQQRYPYVTHIINNAGAGSFTGVDVAKGLYAILNHPIQAVTTPTFKIQEAGERSVDGLGWVWQCNIFGHYVLYRTLLSHLRKSPFTTSRVLWTSSLEADPRHLDMEDWQLVKSKHSYEASKSQIELLAVTLDRDSQSVSEKADEPMIRHILVQPGVVSTAILGRAQLGFLLWILKVASFYLARVLGSKNHTISNQKGGICSVHTLLTPFFDAAQPEPPYTRPTKAKSGTAAFRFNSMTDRMGHPFVEITVVDVPVAGDDGRVLIDEMNKLCDEFVASEGPQGLS